MNRDSKEFINIYTCSGDGYLGWTWLPWSHDEGDWLQAVILNHNSFPGGPMSKYNLGYTAVHEMGHYMGLLHTFSGGSCTAEGDDGVDDTPLESSPASSCSTYKRDTCPNADGYDPIWSFMDYSYDQCMQRFSPGQGARLLEMVNLHRPQLVRNSHDNSVAAVPPPPPPPMPCGSNFGCCGSSNIPKTNYLGSSCPCETTMFGCCGSSDITQRDSRGETCPCVTTKHGCCGSSTTAKYDSAGTNCPCGTTQFGCCGISEMTKIDGQGSNCPCETTQFGCCGSTDTPMRDQEGSNCHCSQSLYGCCGMSSVRKLDFVGSNCPCSSTPYGCCGATDVKQLDAMGSNCPCQATTFGCCGGSEVTKVNSLGSNCHCTDSLYGCCGESSIGKLNYAGSNCPCETTAYGCCPSPYVTLQKTDMVGSTCPTKTTTAPQTQTYPSAVAVTAVGSGNAVTTGDPFDVTVTFSTTVPARVQLVAMLYSEYGLLLGSSEFEDVVGTSFGTATLAVAFHGAVEPQLGCEVKVSLVRADVAANSPNWMDSVEAHIVQSNIAVVAAEAASTPSTGTAVESAFAGCSSAANWNECLNAEPYRTACNWGGHPKACYSVGETVLDTSPSTKTCDEIVTGENMWQNNHPTVCGGSRLSDLTCFGSQDIVKSAAKCRDEGARLCTSEELEYGVTRQSGCGYNFRYAWSSTKCSGGYVVRTGNPNSAYPPLCLDGDAASATTYDVFSRCCADRSPNSVVLAATPQPTQKALSPTASPISVTPAPQPVCRDIALLSNCRMWAGLNFCDVESWDSFMRKNCPLTCKFCSPDTADIALVLPDATPETPEIMIGDDGECTLGVRNRCVNPKKGCCEPGTTCMEMGSTMKCRALPFRGKASHPVGHPCEKHKTCASGWCDRNGRYSPEPWMCWEKEVRTKKPDGVTWFQLEGSNPSQDEVTEEGGSEKNTRLILVSIAIIILLSLGVVLTICIFSSYSKSCKKQSHENGGSSSEGTGESDLMYAFTATNPSDSANGSQRPYASVIDEMSRPGSFLGRKAAV